MSRQVEPIPKGPPRGPKARKRIKPVSDKRRDDRPARQRLIVEVIYRDGGCRARDLVPEVDCASPDPDRAALEVHEIVKRSRWRAGWLIPSNCVALCQAHHDWTEAEPDDAKAVGLLASAPPVRPVS